MMGMEQGERVVELWLRPADLMQAELPAIFQYHPAVMCECFIEFRDVRAEIAHSEDRIYTAWLPGADTAVDWSVRAVENLDPERLEPSPRPEIRAYDREVTLGKKQLEEIEADLIDYLVRTERLQIHYNPSLSLYSKLNESRDEFLHRAAEQARAQLEPALKKVSRHLQMRLQQLREAPLPEDIASERVHELEVIRRQAISQLESQLNQMVLESPQSFLKGLLYARPEFDPPGEIEPLFEQLEMIYDEVRTQVSALITSYLDRVQECEEYRIGLHPNNIRLIRRALLWVPVLC